jgi:hypothetical protein
VNKIDQRVSGTRTDQTAAAQSSAKLRRASCLALSLLAFACGDTTKQDTSGDPSGGSSPGTNNGQANGSASAGNSAGTAGNGSSAGDPGNGTNSNGSSDDDGGAGTTGAGTNNGGTSGGTTGTATPIPPTCMAYELKGLKYSPGGDVLPNTCKPFDTLTNNPWAIRCIDADPSYKTGLEGDEYCILPPDPAKGFQVHIGPSDYAKPEAKYVLKPGDETNDNFPAMSGNESDVYYFYRQYRMRPGSHHLIVSKAGGTSSPFGDGSRLGGSQNLAKDNPELANVPEENKDVGALLPAKTALSVNLHYINTTTKDLVQEAWINFWYKPEAEVKEKSVEMFAMGGLAMNIQPGEHVVLGENGKFSCQVTTAGRVLSLYGHRHASTLRFSAWRKRNGVRELVYEDYDWHDPLVLEYNSTTTNQPHNPQTMSGGGHSGVLDLQPGDALEWECEVDNQTGVPLRFVNETLTGEMCILIGDTVGPKVGCTFQ